MHRHSACYYVYESEIILKGKPSFHVPLGTTLRPQVGTESVRGPLFLSSGALTRGLRVWKSKFFSGLCSHPLPNRDGPLSFPSLPLPSSPLLPPTAHMVAPSSLPPCSCLKVCCPVRAGLSKPFLLQAPSSN